MVHHGIFPFAWPAPMSVALYREDTNECGALPGRHI
jgi:hypothetical protein